MAGASMATLVTVLPSSTVTAMAEPEPSTSPTCDWKSLIACSGSRKLANWPCSLDQINGARATHSLSGTANSTAKLKMTPSRRSTTTAADKAGGTPHPSTRSATGPNIKPTTTASVTGARNTCPNCSMTSSTATPINTSASRAILLSTRSNWLSSMSLASGRAGVRLISGPGAVQMAINVRSTLSFRDRAPRRPEPGAWLGLMG